MSTTPRMLTHPSMFWLSPYSTINHVSIAVNCSKFVSTSTLLYCLLMHLNILQLCLMASPPAAWIHLLPLSPYSTINHVSIAVNCSKFVSTSPLLYCLLMHPKHITIVSHGISTSHLNRFAVIVGNKCNFESITSFSVTIEI